MPHFTIQVSPRGPIIEALVGVSVPRREALLAAGHAVPKVMQIRGLLDTGASHSALDPIVLNALALTPTGTVLVNTPTTGAAPVSVDQYDVAFLIPVTDSPPLFNKTLPVMASSCSPPRGSTP